jgi:hypothetical protein
LTVKGFGRQLEAVTAYAKVHDWEIIKVYREEAVPGKTEMQALIELAPFLMPLPLMCSAS